tara:strand:+ start:163 stop:294 length:132 start_codon:yes stop_codon:yes gene_type:complete
MLHCKKKGEFQWKELKHIEVLLAEAQNKLKNKEHVSMKIAHNF